eukprot:2088965-Prymnesium_polylepis.1
MARSVGGERTPPPSAGADGAAAHGFDAHGFNPKSGSGSWLPVDRQLMRVTLPADKSCEPPCHEAGGGERQHGAQPREARPSPRCSAPPPL